MLKFALASVAAALVAVASAGAASAATQDHYFIMTNSTTQTLTQSGLSASGSGGTWVLTPGSPAVTGSKKSGDYETNDYATITFSDTWTAGDGTACKFSIYSQVNSYGNIQFYPTITKSGPQASTIQCTTTAPTFPYSTTHGNIEWDFTISGI